MSRHPQRVSDYLAHIVQATERIERFIRGLDEPAFLANELVQDAVIRNLEVVGEACRNIERADPGFAATHPQLPLQLAADMRNALAHGYFRVDLRIVWATVQRDLPRMQATTRALLDSLPGPPCA